MSEIKERLAEYEEVYDFYMEQGNMPEDRDDLLCEYMERIIKDNPGIDLFDEIWKEILKEEVMTFMEMMLRAFAPMEEEHKRQQEKIEMFREATVNGKREMWKEIYDIIKADYGVSEVNIDAYAQQFGGEFREAVAAALATDWERANDKRLEEGKRECAERGLLIMENRLIQCGENDYEKRMEFEEEYHHYPQLKEIVRMIGREKPQDPIEKDEIIYRYIPLLPGAQVEHVDVEMIAASNDIRSMTPAEMAIMSDKDTELLFYERYASGQLLTFANKPLIRGQKKGVVVRKTEHRLIEGPIIVALDTSGSMRGKPERIAHSLLMQLLRMARKQKRRCHIITFSVRAKSMDLTGMRGWNEVISFLQSGFTGGTNGEEMLQRALEQLAGERYEMADILIISDFYFYKPLEGTLIKMEEERAKGVCFHGLQIGKHCCEYQEILDNVWKV